MVKGLHKLFKAVVNDISPASPFFGQSGLVVSYLIPEPRNFSEMTILSEDIKKYWLKATMKEINNLINNQTFLVDKSKKVVPSRRIIKG